MSKGVHGNRFAALALASALAGFSSMPAHAEPPQPAGSDAPAYSVNTSLAANLKSLSGKRVTVHLKSGTALTGTVKAVGDHLVHLEKLEGRDFFDALVATDEVGAIDTRARTPGR
jgi:hypothetical protein